MQRIIRTCFVSILGLSAAACAAHGQVTVQGPPPPPPPAATVVVERPAPPPPQVVVVQRPAPPPPVVVVQQPPPPPPPPPPPAVHPAYLHALSDLRSARFNLARRGGDPTMRWDEAVAIAAIDRAIAEIKRASIDDGKSLDDHPPVDAHEPRVGRMHRALSALRAAHHDVNEEEDNAYAQGLKARAIHHIDEAIRLTEQGVAEAERGI
jgi:hypothetical protein